MAFFSTVLSIDRWRIGDTYHRGEEEHDIYRCVEPDSTARAISGTVTATSGSQLPRPTWHDLLRVSLGKHLMCFFRQSISHKLLLSRFNVYKDEQKITTLI